MRGAMMAPLLLGALTFLGISEAYKLVRRIGETPPATPSRAATPRP